MDVLSIGIGAVIGFIIAFIIATLLNKTKSVPNADFDNLNATLAQTKADLALSQGREQDRSQTIKTLTGEKDILTEQLGTIRKENAALEGENKSANEKLATLKKEIEELHAKTLLQFENLANDILDSKSKKFTATNQENIEQILKPLGVEIKSFKEKVEETYNKESKERFSLGEKVTELIQQTGKVSEEANNLASALKGQSKKRGDWGEVILERVLEASGLERGREYKVQEPIRNDDGNLLRPDVLVYLPDKRNVIIDSKISLVAYDRYCASDSDEDQSACLEEHLQSLYNHIDQLHEKKYDEITSSLDFTLMFVPIEPAYLLAVQSDDQLWAKAYQKRIILISPTNLIAVIKIVSDLWNRERQSKHALEIAKQGQTLYDKFVGFLETMEDVGKHINKSQEAYTKATNQLKLGRGNLVSQAEKLKALGIASKKAIPSSMANFEGHHIETDSDGENQLLAAGILDKDDLPEVECEMDV